MTAADAGHAPPTHTRLLGQDIRRLDPYGFLAVFEVADGELADGVAAVIGVQLHGAAGPIGDEGVVAPVGPQGGLWAGQAGGRTTSRSPANLVSAT
jgi:hypothetical protein